MNKKITPERKICLCGCGKIVTPNYRRRVIQNPRFPGLLKEGEILSIEGYGYNDNGYFDTLRCGFRWAVNSLNKTRK